MRSEEGRGKWGKRGMGSPLSAPDGAPLPLTGARQGDGRMGEKGGRCNAAPTENEAEELELPGPEEVGGVVGGGEGGGHVLVEGAEDGELEVREGGGGEVAEQFGELAGARGGGVGVARKAEADAEGLRTGSIRGGSISVAGR